MPQSFRESTFSSPDEIKVDREAGVIRGVKCLGRESKNGRVYADQALEDARGLYEGVDVNLDHPAPEAVHADRKMHEGFGVLRDVRVLKEGVFADLHFLKSHPLADVIAERAERFPGNFGLSHNAIGSVVEDHNSGTLVVESLDAVESVDVVRRPATNAGLFESLENGGATVPTKTKKPTVRQVLERTKKNKLAANLLLLLEEEGMEATAAAPVEASPEAAPEEQVKGAFRAMVIAAFDDSSLDTAGTIARIKEILKAQEKLEKKPDAGGADAADAVADVAEEPVAESIAKRLDKFERREAIREALEDRGLKRSDLSDAQRRLLAKSDVDDLEDLLEAWDVKPASKSPRPNVRSARIVEEEETDDDLRASVFGKKK